jgi:hypothetical protein
MTTTVALQLLLIICVFVFPISVLFVEMTDKSHTNLAMGMMMLAIFNIPTAFAAVSFVLALLIVLIHRVTWPLLSTWTYVLTRKEVLEKRKVVRTVSVALLIYGLSGIPQLAFILKLVQLFNK